MDATGNPLNYHACNIDIPAMETDGATVLHDPCTGILPPAAAAWGNLIGTLAVIILSFILMMVILGLVLSGNVDIRQALAVALMGIVGIMIVEILIIAIF